MAKEKTIEELWGNLQKEEAKSANHWKRFEKTQSDSSLIWHTKAKANVLILRQLLLKRCRKVVGPHGHDSLFEEFDNSKVRITTWDGLGYTHHSRIDDANSAREMSAAYAFWAWELEQRQNEQQSGN